MIHRSISSVTPLLTLWKSETHDNWDSHVLMRTHVNPTMEKKLKLRFQLYISPWFWYVGPLSFSLSQILRGNIYFHLLFLAHPVHVLVVEGIACSLRHRHRERSIISFIGFGFGKAAHLLIDSTTVVALIVENGRVCCWRGKKKEKTNNSLSLGNKRELKRI